MKRYLLPVLVLLLAACAAPPLTPASTPTPTATTVPTATPTSTPSPTFSPAPTDTATPRPTATPAPVSAALQEILDRVTATLPTVRQLEFKKPLPPRLMSRAELEAYLREQIDEKNRKELKITEELYTLLGLIEPGTDLYLLYLDLLGEQVLGLFDPDKEELYLIGESRPLGVLDELTLAHEYTHALQQQHFDIARLSKEVEGLRDRETALLALIEGDATRSQLDYGLTRFGRAALQEAFRNTGPSPVFDRTPQVVRKTLLFPYDHGSRFVQAVYNSTSSWRAVNAAYLIPPVSTEQVLHPSAYLTREDPVDVQLPDFLGALGQGWTLIEGDTFGEFLLRVWLEEDLSSTRAAAAAAGWGGDRYVLLRGPAGEGALVLLTVWDMVEDAEEFYGAFQEFIPLAYGSDRQGERPGRKVHLSRAGQGVLVVFAPTQPVLDALLQQVEQRQRVP